MDSWNHRQTAQLKSFASTAKQSAGMSTDLEGVEVVFVCGGLPVARGSKDQKVLPRVGECVRFQRDYVVDGITYFYEQGDGGIALLRRVQIHLKMENSLRNQNLDRSLGRLQRRSPDPTQEGTASVVPKRTAGPSTR